MLNTTQNTLPAVTNGHPSPTAQRSPIYPQLTVISPHKTPHPPEPYLLDFGQLIPQNNSGADLVITLGRGDHNHIALPDPEHQISRNQCRFVQRKGCWCIEDEGSANGTYVRREGEPVEMDIREKPLKLQQQDEILILGAWEDEETPLFWHLIWHDPGRTLASARFQSAYLEYCPRQQKLYRILDQQREVITLTPKQHRFIQYLALRYESSGGEPEPCTPKELIPVVWDGDDAVNRTKQDVNHLICHIRKIVEPDMGEPRWLLTAPGGGYVLKVKVL